MSDYEAQFQTTIVEMTPERAKKILADNGRNRVLRTPQVEFHLNNINQGLWELTHQGVAIDTNGELLDGQHRLQAIAMSGKTVPIMLTEGLKPELMNVIDTGARRSPGDVFSISGITHPAVAAATVRTVMNFRQDRWSNEVVPHSTLLDAYKQDSQGYALAIELAKPCHKDVGMAPSLLCAVTYMTQRSAAPEPRINEWLRMFLEGVELRKDDVAYVLRRQFRNIKADSKRMPARTWLGMYAKGFNLFVLDRKTPQYIRFLDSDTLPSIEQPGASIRNPLRVKR